MKIHPVAHRMGRLISLGLCLMVARAGVAADCVAAPDTVQQRLANATINHCPRANAGSDLTMPAGQLVTLDASGSSDLDAQALRYAWRVISAPMGSGAQIADPHAIRTAFTPDLDGTYVVELTVKDLAGAVSTDLITLSTLGSAPVARAGDDRTAAVGKPVYLDGIGSYDLDGQSLTYQWQLTDAPAGSQAQLDAANRADASFVPDLAGDYVAELVVSDGRAFSTADSVRISTLNSRPVAHAGSTRTLAPGSTMLLDAQRSFDADGDALFYDWRLIARPAGANVSLQGADAPMAQAFLTDVGQYVFQLVTSDGEWLSEPATVLVDVTARRVQEVDRDAAREQVMENFRGATTDQDGDGVLDVDDNCLLISNADQRDTDADGFGNACDADLNNDGIVNVIDLGILRTRFFTNDPDADFNGDGIVNVVDLGILRSRFFLPPGPAGLIIWVSLVDGDFDNPMNWEPMTVPSAGTFALINVDPAVTVTATSDTIVVGNIVNNETLTLVNSSFEATNGLNSSGPINVSGGSVTNTTFAPAVAGAGTINITGTSTWTAAVFDLDASMPNGTTVNATGGMTINSTFTINAPSQTTGIIASTSMTIDGTGAIVLNGVGNSVIAEPRIIPTNGTTLTIGSDLTIRGGKGTVGNVSANVVFNGALDADVPGETLRLAANILTGSGTLVARSGSEVEIDAIINNPGNALLLDGPDGTVRLLNTTQVINTTLNMTPGTVAQIPNNAIITMQNAVINGDMEQFNASTINASGTLTLNGTSTINAPTQSTGYVFIDDTVVDGAAVFVINGTGNSVQAEPRMLPANGTLLTIGPTVTVRGGNGTIGNAFAGLDFQGVLISDVSGEELAIGSANWAANNQISAINGGGIRFFGTMNNGGAALSVDTADGGLRLTNGSQINLATINGTAGTTMVVPQGSYTWTSDVMNVDVSIENAANVSVFGGLSYNGSMLITAPSQSTGLVFGETQTLTGTGTIRLDGTDNSVQAETRLFPVNGTTLTIDSGINVRGGNGTVGQSFAALVLLGTLDADVDGQELAIGGSSWSANNAMTATNNGGIRFFGSMNNGDETLDIDTADGFFNWSNGGQINNATLLGTTGTRLRVPSGTYTMTTSVIDVDVTIENGGNINVSSGLTFNGDMLIDAPTLSTGLVFLNSMTLDGSGTIEFDGIGNSSIAEPRLFPNNGTTLTVGPGITVRGANGTVGNAFASLVFNGTLSADVAGEQINIGGSLWSANQTLQAIGGGNIGLFGNHDNGSSSLVLDSATTPVLVLSSAALRNTTINGTAGTQLTFFSSTTLDNATITADMEINNGTSVSVLNGLTVNGTATINAPTNPTGMVFTNTQSLLGDLTVVFNGGSNSVITEPRLFPNNNTTLTIGPNVRIEGGTGTIGNPFGSLVLDGAVVDASNPGETLRIDGAMWSASNTLGTSNGGLLELRGVMDNAGGAVTLDATGFSARMTGTSTLRDVVINGTPGTGLVISASATFDSLTYNGDLTINNAVNVTVIDGLTINGTLTINAPTSPSGLVFSNTQSLLGNLNVVFNGNNVITEARLFPNNGTDLTLGPNVSIRGDRGTVGQPFADTFLEGSMIADTGNLQATRVTPVAGATLGADGGFTLAATQGIDQAITFDIGPASTVDVDGAVNMLSGSVMSIDVDATGSGLLTADDGITHNGTLNLSAVNGFAPANGFTFDVTNIVTPLGGNGAFATVNSAGLGGGQSFGVTYNVDGEAIATVN